MIDHRASKACRVTALGTGSAVGLPPRGHASLLLELGDEPLLVDAPGDAAARMLAAGTDPLDLRVMVLTHHHEDHWGGLPSLLLHRLVRRRFGVALRPGEAAGASGEPLRILAPPATAAFLEQLLSLIGRREEAVIDRFDDGDPPIAVGGSGWSLQAVAGEHGSMPVIGIVARDPDGRAVVAYSSDSEPTDRFLRAAAGVDLLVHECQQATRAPASHADAESLAAAISRLTAEGVPPPRRLAAMHILADPPEEAERIRRTLERDLPPAVGVMVPEDGTVLLERAAIG
jgi:ribonuclease BN (tRNA processing enzyme)